MEEILNDDRLLRRIPIHPNYIKDDNRITSLAFKPRKGDNGLSVNIERFTTYLNTIQDKTKYRLAALQAGFVRSIGFETIHNPLTDNYAHALIIGNFSHGNCKKMAIHAITVQL